MEARSAVSAVVFAALVVSVAGTSCIPYESVCLRNSDCGSGEVCSSAGTCVIPVLSDAEPGAEASSPAPMPDAQSPISDAAVADALPKDASSDSGNRDAGDSGKRDGSDGGVASDSGKKDGSVTDARTAWDSSRSGG